MAAQPFNPSEPEPAPEPLEEKKKKSKAPLVIALLLVMIVAVAAAVTIKVATGKHHAKRAPQKVEVGEVITLDEFLLNSADTSGDHYIKATVAVGLVKGKSADEFKNKIPIARDAIVMDLSSKTMADVRTTQGKLALKQELTDKINQELGEQDVAQVYLVSFATQ